MLLSFFMPTNRSYEHKQQVAQVRGREGGGGIDERGRTHTDGNKGMNTENWERQIRQREVASRGRHCTSVHLREIERERERGEREGVM